MSNTQPEPITGTGRPRKVDGPRVPYTEIDRVLVFGEIVPCADGETRDVRYPSYRELAARYGVSHSLIAQYSKRHDCLRRREDARHRVTARAEQKLVELRASAMAYARDDEPPREPPAPPESGGSPARRPRRFAQLRGPEGRCPVETSRRFPRRQGR